MRVNLNPATSTTGLVLLLVLSCAWPALALDRSQVFSLHTPLEGQPLSVLEDFRVDTIGWGSADDPNMQAVRDMGIEYHMAMSLSVWGGAAAADPQTPTGQQVCINFLGGRIPAFGTGFPQGGLYRMCTNRPGWNFAWLERYAADGMEGFEMDCPPSSNGQLYSHMMQGSCFCETCLHRFRVYLAENYTAEELTAKGVPNVFEYNHRDTVSSVCGSINDLPRRLKDGSIKLASDFLLFQNIAGSELGRRTNKLIRSAATGPTVITPNAWYMEAYNLYSAEFADYFLAETDYHAGMWPRAVEWSLSRVVKVAEAAGKQVVCAPSIADMKKVMKAGSKPNEMTLWVAGTYALGANHTAPVNYQWAGKPFFMGDPAVYAPIYQWIKDNTELFDGYDSYDEGVALLYDNWAYNKQMDELALGSRAYMLAYQSATMQLSRQNVQFDVVILGDPYFYKRLASESDLAPYHTFFVPDDSFLHGSQKALVQDLLDSGEATLVKNSPNVKNVIKNLDLSVIVNDDSENGDNVWAYIRKNPTSKNVAVHLVNRLHNHETDVVTTRTDLKLSVRQDVLGGYTIDNIMLYAPGKSPRALQYRIADGRIDIDVPELYMWDIVIISVDDNPDIKKLMLDASGRGWVKPGQDAPYQTSDVVTLTAMPDPGWQFGWWSGGLTGSTNPVTITMEGDRSVVAHFTEVNPPVERKLTIEVVTTNETPVWLEPAVARRSVPPHHDGDVVTLTAMPIPHWQFDSWSGDLSGNTNPVTITMDRDKKITATFSPRAYSVSITTAGDGSVEASPKPPYAPGDTVRLTATPTPGSQFIAWSGSVSGSAASVELVVDEDKEVIATFGDPETAILTSAVEEFGATGWHVLDTGTPDDENPGVPASTYVWGCYNNYTDPYGKPMLAIDAGGTIRIVLPSTAGTYIYTRFGQAKAPRTPRFRVDASASGSTAEVLFGRSKGGQVALLLRDGTGWFQSSSLTIPENNTGFTPKQDHSSPSISFTLAGPSAVTWTPVSGTADMDEVDTGGESPITPGGAGSPDLTRIEGMGLRITTSPGQGAWIDINRIAIRRRDLSVRSRQQHDN